MALLTQHIGGRPGKPRIAARATCSKSSARGNRWQKITATAGKCLGLGNQNEISWSVFKSINCSVGKLTWYTWGVTVCTFEMVLIANGIWWDRCTATDLFAEWKSSILEGSSHVFPSALQSHQVDGQVAPSLTLRSLECWITICRLCVTGTVKNHVRTPLQGHLGLLQREITFEKTQQPVG